MRIPALQGTIDRRILLNYRVAPDVLQKLLPPPFRPKLAGDAGIAGVCLIRLTSIRPHGLPSILGISSENAAHRIAVEWEAEDGMREGVFVPRRDSSSRLNTLVGGRLFAGVYHHARFGVSEREDHFQVAVDSDDGQTRLAIDADVAPDLPGTSHFGSLKEASAFFEAGALGYSPAARPGAFDGIELCSATWSVQPLAVNRVYSSFFDNSAAFPPGTTEFDCALLMRGIEHEWRARGTLRSADLQEEEAPRVST